MAEPALSKRVTFSEGPDEDRPKVSSEATAIQRIAATTIKPPVVMGRTKARSNTSGFHDIAFSSNPSMITSKDDSLQKPKLSGLDIPRLREQWLDRYSDILGPIPLELPPLREVNHHIPLIDEDIRYNYHLPRCPEALESELREKTNRYISAGWWEMKAVYQAAPLLCVPKKSGKLRTVVDARKRNDNTFKDVTPFPDQDQIRMDVARAKYRTKIDMSDAYEQI